MIKSERLKKLEAELKDLEKWIDLDLVPKKDLEKHRAEIEVIKKRIDDELQRLMFLKESGELEEFTAPKKSQAKQMYDPQSMSDARGDESSMGGAVESSAYEPDNSTLFDIEDGGEEKGTQEHNSEGDPYSDKNRWKRANIADPEGDDW